LKRLLVYHGRESYRRNSNLILYNFFKNVLLVLPVFWLGFSMAFSGQQIYDTWLYSLFNVFYASLPIVIYAVLDKQYRNKNKCLLVYPALYQPGIKSVHFNGKRFWLWFFNAVIQSVIVGQFW
jgi:phospholipid-transporting ATPase